MKNTHAIIKIIKKKLFAIIRTYFLKLARKLIFCQINKVFVHKLVDGLIHLLHVPSRSQLADMFTKSLHPSTFRVATSKLGLYNLHAYLKKG